MTIRARLIGLWRLWRFRRAIARAHITPMSDEEIDAEMRAYRAGKRDVTRP